MIKSYMNNCRNLCVMSYWHTGTLNITPPLGCTHRTIPERCGAEVDQLYAALVRQTHDILRFDIPMGEPTFVALSQHLHACTKKLKISKHTLVFATG
jgi:hypothetical protein